MAGGAANLRRTRHPIGSAEEQLHVLSPFAPRKWCYFRGEVVNLCRVRETHHNRLCMVRFTHPTDCSRADAEAKDSRPRSERRHLLIGRSVLNIPRYFRLRHRQASHPTPPMPSRTRHDGSGTARAGGRRPHGLAVVGQHDRQVVDVHRAVPGELALRPGRAGLPKLVSTIVRSLMSTRPSPLASPSSPTWASWTALVSS